MQRTERGIERWRGELVTVFAMTNLSIRKDSINVIVRHCDNIASALEVGPRPPGLSLAGLLAGRISDRGDGMRHWEKTRLGGERARKVGGAFLALAAVGSNKLTKPLGFLVM